jgi:outer membrane PBP1 activator LpoA protein
MSLAPEDEAVRIAELAFGQGARSALVIKPAGQWGDKVEDVLKARWAALGGTVTNSVYYKSREDYSNSIRSALDISASEIRARDVRSMLATNIEFTARRRQDVDVVFLLSRNGAEARSIKPLLAFHYAGNLPVYAMSTIYSGIPDPRDRDLNGINLVETPWLLGSNPSVRVAIAAGDTGSDNYTRLNALGADAFLLQSRFSQLQAGPDALIRGDTGLLSMDPQLQIHRELSLATFDEGALKAQ